MGGRGPGVARARGAPHHLQVNGEKWQPKDAEVRTLDVKQVFADYLAQERDRQEQQGILGQFVLVAGNSRNTGYRGKPLSEGAIRQAMKKLMKALNMVPQVTPYCLRHTYATTLLRSGVDIRTVQARMGHSRITTTMGYLHYVSVSDHPTDKLPY
ncbi:MAG: tyrosine-type recombinase/integrase [Chloroflexi bacterium]|nr:tyrosine-type recombinase/integrase [Chloroflexota bacterium]